MDCAGDCKFETGLQVRALKNSRIQGHHDEVLYAHNASIPPIGLSLLTMLQTLDLVFDSYTEEPISLEWVCELTSLQDLNIVCVHGRSELIEVVSSLSSLTGLVVTGPGMSAGHFPD